MKSDMEHAGSFADVGRQMRALGVQRATCLENTSWVGKKYAPLDHGLECLTLLGVVSPPPRNSQACVIRDSLVVA